LDTDKTYFKDNAQGFTAQSQCKSSSVSNLFKREQGDSVQKTVGFYQSLSGGNPVDGCSEVQDLQEARQFCLLVSPALCLPTLMISLINHFFSNQRPPNVVYINAITANLPDNLVE